jgi:glycerol kinase
MTHILAIDQGTTSSRAILFDQALRPVASAQEEFPQHYPRPGWVEHDPGRSLVHRRRHGAGRDREGGGCNLHRRHRHHQPARDDPDLGPQDRPAHPPRHRLAGPPHRRHLRRPEGPGPRATITARTGLLLDPISRAPRSSGSSTTSKAPRPAPKRGELAFGTVDTWLIWNLTGGKVHATDATNASRTLLYNIAEGRWDDDICELLGIPMSLLPEVKDCAAPFGVTRPDLFGREIPILGVAGDQQAATVGQACFSPGMMKSTYGTGCFALLNTGKDMVPSKNRLLTTIAYQLQGQPTYALEGSIFIAGAVVQWLRDGLKIIREAKETQPLADAGRGSAGRDPRPRLHRPRRALLAARLPGRRLRADPQFRPGRVRPCRAGKRRLPDPRPSGGDAGRLGRCRRWRPAGRWRHDRQRLDHAIPVRHPGRARGPTEGHRNHRLGAAYLAAMQAGVIGGPEEFAKSWALDRRFTPAMDDATRDAKYARWGKAIAATMSV